MKQKHARHTKTERNPLYVKIGKRIRQARLMAKESNSRALSERLGWSGIRINNFETGASTPGVGEALKLSEVLGVSACVGSSAGRTVSAHRPTGKVSRSAFAIVLLACRSCSVGQADDIAPDLNEARSSTPSMH